MATVEELIDGLDLDNQEMDRSTTYFLGLLNDVKADLVKLGIKEALLNDGISDDEVDNALEANARGLIQYIDSDIFDKIKTTDYASLKTEFLGIKKEYKHLVKEGKKAFKKLDHDYITEVLGKYHCYNKILTDF